MIEPDIRQKIINTISRYEKKCDNLEEDISCLKNALSELAAIPRGISVDLDPQIDQLRLDLENDAKPQTIQTRVNVLIAVLTRWISKVQEKNAFVNVMVNESLQQLINHLAMPEVLQSRIAVIRDTLEKPLENANLSFLIDRLTDLMVEAFNLKQNQFKDFLQQVSEQIRHFDEYLNFTATHNDEASRESVNLESGIEYNLEQIKNHMVSARTLDELSSNLQQNLEGIGQHLKAFREREEQRKGEFEEKMQLMQEKLSLSEQAFETVQNRLSSQTFQIYHDALTGLDNRISYDAHIREAFKRRKQNHSDLCLAVADIDFFKKINDSYGHLAGDKVLKKIGLLFKTAIRSTDFVGRYGGEEFVFIFEKTSREQGLMILEKLRKLAEDCQFSYNHQKVLVSLSFGLTVCKDNDTVESFFARADKAMYQAKTAGRNQVLAL